MNQYFEVPTRLSSDYLLFFQRLETFQWLTMTWHKRSLHTVIEEKSHKSHKTAPAPWPAVVHWGLAMCVLSRVHLFATTFTVACQALLSVYMLQATVLELVTIPSSRRSSQPRDWTQVPCIAGWFSTIWATGTGACYRRYFIFLSWLYFIDLQDSKPVY